MEKKMVTAYVLAKVMPNQEKVAKEQVLGLVGVESADFVFGKYDMVIKLRADTLNELDTTILESVRGVETIDSTETLIAGKIENE